MATDNPSRGPDIPPPPPPPPERPKTGDRVEPSNQKKDTPSTVNDSTQHINSNTHSKMQALREPVSRGVEHLKGFTGNVAHTMERAVGQIEQPTRKAAAIGALYVIGISGLPDASRHDQPTRNDNVAATQRATPAQHGVTRPSTEIRAADPEKVAPAAAPKERGGEDAGMDAAKGIGEQFGDIAEDRNKRRRHEDEGENARDARRAATEQGEQYPH